MRRIATDALTELLGTFVLLLAVVSAESSGTRWAPLVGAAVLVLLVVLGSGRLGGHFNPAVSLAEAVRGRAGDSERLPGGPRLLTLLVRWTAQAAGGALGALLGHAIARHHPMSQALHGHALLRAGAGELVITFTLVWVVLDVLRRRMPSTSPRSAPRPHRTDEPAGGRVTPADAAIDDGGATRVSGESIRSAETGDDGPDEAGDTTRMVVMAVGLVATVLLLTVGRVSGMALNPAVVLGRGIARLTVWQGLWPWVLVELLAGLLAGLGVRLLDRRPTRGDAAGDADTVDRDAVDGHAIDRGLPGASAAGTDPAGTSRID